LGEKALKDIADDIIVLAEIRQRFYLAKGKPLMDYLNWREFVERNSRYSLRTIQNRLAEVNGKDESKVNDRFKEPKPDGEKPRPESVSSTKVAEYPPAGFRLSERGIYSYYNQLTRDFSANLFGFEGESSLRLEAMTQGDKTEKPFRSHVRLAEITMQKLKTSMERLGIWRAEYQKHIEQVISDVKEDYPTKLGKSKQAGAGDSQSAL
jgi:hypothetical protein